MQIHAPSLTLTEFIKLVISDTFFFYEISHFCFLKIKLLLRENFCGLYWIATKKTVSPSPLSGDPIHRQTKLFWFLQRVENNNAASCTRNRRCGGVGGAIGGRSAGSAGIK
jgi:hypothetical protein